MSSISDFLTTFNSPIIYCNQTQDSAALLSYLVTSFGLTATLQVPPPTTTVSNLDEFLNGNDIILIGGPIANTASQTVQDSLQAELAAIGLQSLSFTTAELDGTVYGDKSPQISIVNANGTFVFGRSEDVNDTIADQAVVLRLQGTTNSLLYVAGIRDFGTAVAFHVLYWIQQDSSSWPTELFGNVSTLADWKTTFASNAAVIIQFYIPADMNEANLSDFIAYINANGIGGPPDRDIGPAVGTRMFVPSAVSDSLAPSVSVTSIIADPKFVSTDNTDSTIIVITAKVYNIDQNTKLANRSSVIVTTATLSFSQNGSPLNFDYTVAFPDGSAIIPGDFISIAFSVTVPAHPGFAAVDVTVNVTTLDNLNINQQLLGSLTVLSVFGTTASPLAIVSLKPDIANIFPGGLIKFTASVINLSNVSITLISLSDSTFSILVSDVPFPVSFSYEGTMTPLVALAPNEVGQIVGIYSLQEGADFSGPVNMSAVVSGRITSSDIAVSSVVPIDFLSLFKVSQKIGDNPLVVSMTVPSSVISGTFETIPIRFSTNGNVIITNLIWRLDFGPLDGSGHGQNNSYFAYVNASPISSSAIAPRFVNAVVGINVPSTIPDASYLVTLSYSGTMRVIVGGTLDLQTGEIVGGTVTNVPVSGSINSQWFVLGGPDLLSSNTDHLVLVPTFTGNVDIILGAAEANNFISIFRNISISFFYLYNTDQQIDVTDHYVVTARTVDTPFSIPFTTPISLTGFESATLGLTLAVKQIDNQIYCANAQTKCITMVCTFDTIYQNLVSGQSNVFAYPVQIAINFSVIPLS